MFRATYGDAAQYAPAGEPVALLAALARSPALRAEWGARAATAARRYEADRGGEKVLAAYRPLVR